MTTTRKKPKYRVHCVGCGFQASARRYETVEDIVGDHIQGCPIAGLAGALERQAAAADARAAMPEGNP